MVGLDHGATGPAEDEDPQVVARHARLGLRLFLAYCALYAGFMLLNVLGYDWLALRLWRGINLAVLSGFGLIAAAMVVALIYAWLCRQPKQGHGEPRR
jgi:uncharacterized membrane protein (DUF485 family)